MPFLDRAIFRVENRNDIDIWFYRGKFYKLPSQTRSEKTIRELRGLLVGVSVLLSVLLLHFGMPRLNALLAPLVGNPERYHALMSGVIVVSFPLAMLIGRRKSIGMINNKAIQDEHYSASDISTETAKKEWEETRSILLAISLAMAVILLINFLLEGLMTANVSLSIFVLLCIAAFGFAFGIQSIPSKLIYMDGIIKSRNSPQA